MTTAKQTGVHASPYFLVDVLSGVLRRNFVRALRACRLRCGEASSRVSRSERRILSSRQMHKMRAHGQQLCQGRRPHRRSVTRRPALCGSWVTAQAGLRRGLCAAPARNRFAPPASPASRPLAWALRRRSLPSHRRAWIFRPPSRLWLRRFGFRVRGRGFPCGFDAAFASMTAGCSRHVWKRASSSVPWSFHQTSSNLSAFLKLSGAVGRKPFISMSMDGCLPTSAIADLRIGP